MTESFFDRLELELRAAAERPPRRLAGLATAVRGGAIALAVAAAIALALIPAFVLLGGGDDGRLATEPDSAAKVPAVGTVIHDGEGRPPRHRDHTVVATGTTPYAGPWQMETYLSSSIKGPDTGEEYQEAGLPCLDLYLTDPPPGTSPGGGQCGVFPRTPGFSRVQHTSPSTMGGAKEVLVFGRTPEQATAVVLTADGGIRTEVKPFPGPEGVEGGFYLIPVEPGMEHARVNWLDRDGNEGSRGIGLLPPASGHVKRG